MTSFNSSRRTGLRDLGEAWHWCNACPVDERKWLPGGERRLAKHLRLFHGVVDEWPDTRVVDCHHRLLDHDGNPVTDEDGDPVAAPTTVAGWITTRPSKARLWRDR